MNTALYVFIFCGCKKGCYGFYIIPISNHQKLIEEKTLSKCDVVIFINHLCIINNAIDNGNDDKMILIIIMIMTIYIDIAIDKTMDCANGAKKSGGWMDGWTGGRERGREQKRV